MRAASVESSSRCSSAVRMRCTRSRNSAMSWGVFSSRLRISSRRSSRHTSMLRNRSPTMSPARLARAAAWRPSSAAWSRACKPNNFATRSFERPAMPSQRSLHFWNSSPWRQSTTCNSSRSCSSSALRASSAAACAAAAALASQAESTSTRRCRASVACRSAFRTSSKPSPRATRSASKACVMPPRSSELLSSAALPLCVWPWSCCSSPSSASCIFTSSSSLTSASCAWPASTPLRICCSSRPSLLRSSRTISSNSALTAPRALWSSCKVRTSILSSSLRAATPASKSRISEEGSLKAQTSLRSSPCRAATSIFKSCSAAKGSFKVHTSLLSSPCKAQTSACKSCISDDGSWRVLTSFARSSRRLAMSVRKLCSAAPRVSRSKRSSSARLSPRPRS
mmetsp:Transcript_78296/g.254262  ORF Transcript_78296/g.254262 Transcript_78296/m.254262 type:complete len:396 (+) Transcript_78296:1978-3165(+)